MRSQASTAGSCALSWRLPVGRRVCESVPRLTRGSGTSGGRSLGTNVEAHITGTVFSIETEVGAEISAGDVLVVIESMKMELPVEAPSGGKVAEIRGEDGQSVEECEVIVTLD